MECSDDKLYEYAVVRYVPKLEREEFLNIGLLMMCRRRKWMKGEIYLNAEKLKSIDPLADIDFLTRQAGLFRRTDVPRNSLPIEEKYRWLTAVKSSSLQVSPSHPGLLTGKEDMKPRTSENEDLEEEFERLFEILVK